MSIQTKPFPEQALLMATFSRIAYLDEGEGKRAFANLGYDACLVSVEGSEAYFITDGVDLIVACRGTEPTQWSDIAADLDARLTASSTGVGFVHKGFKTSVDHVWTGLAEKLMSYGKQRTIWCTGHSLGAAMATLLAYRLQRTETMPDPQALFTFGSPRVGDKTYIRAIEASGLLHFRFVNNTDLVPRVPVWPFHHFGGMYYMNHWGNLRTASGWQLTKDVWRGFVQGIKNRTFSLIDNHDIGHYEDNLNRWVHGVENPQ
jgi:triacylglycerol lipase